MNILFLTFHFEPDLSAGAFKNTPLVKALLTKMNPTDTIEVITTVPNRYYSYKNETFFMDEEEGLKIHRIEIPVHKNGLADQVYAFISFYFKVQQITKKQKYDLVYASSSRLFTAFLGARIAQSLRIPLYLDIRDIFVDTLNDVLKSRLLKWVLLPLLKLIEKYTIQSADHLNLVSEGFRHYFSYYQGTTTFFSNGIDDLFLSDEFRGRFPEKDITKPQIITYAGNIGEGQGLEKILPQVAKSVGSDFSFKIIGDGGTRKKLENLIKKSKVENIELIAPVSRESLKKYYHQSDYLFLHLNDYEAFKKVLPSKVFEYGATNKTILAGVSGYAKDFIEEHLENSIVFDPGDAKSLTNHLLNHQPKEINRQKFREKFTRTKILDEMSESILRLVGRNEE